MTGTKRAKTGMEFSLPSGTSDEEAEKAAAVLGFRLTYVGSHREYDPVFRRYDGDLVKVVSLEPTS